MINDEYKKILRKYHKLSDRHILVAETDMPYSDVLKVVALSDKIRKAGNELVGLVRKNYEQLMRTKRYCKLLFCMEILRKNSNVKIWLFNLTRCRNHIMSHGIIVEHQ